MHLTAMRHGELFFKTYLTGLQNAVVVDIGAQDVNGSLKSVCPSNARYIGVDFAAAPGVDIVLADPYTLPFADSSIDVVVSSSCFEHSELFWVLFLEILRVLKPEGLLYVNAPSNNDYHRYPVDCWRFYPDAGLALQTWARRNGYKTSLLESFLGKADRDLWVDFVAVFVKDENSANDYSNRMIHQLANYSNGRSYPAADELLRPRWNLDANWIWWRRKTQVLRQLWQPKTS
jgi:SAM-dependent methyltransferase